jgi:hypothetical protein
MTAQTKTETNKETRNTQRYKATQHQTNYIQKQQKTQTKPQNTKTAQK